MSTVLAVVAVWGAGCGSDPQQPAPLPGPELFDFTVSQAWSSPIPSPSEVRVADFNGDGRADLAFNFKSGPTNALYYAFASAADTFVVSATSTHPTAVAEGWERYATLSGRFDPDPVWDLGWSYTGTLNSTWYGLSDGAGNVDFAPRMDHTRGGWHGFVTLVLDVDADGIHDLAWNETTPERNRVSVGITNIFGFLEMRAAQSFAAADWSAFEVTHGDHNGDGRADLLWTEPSGRRIYTATGNEDGVFDLSEEIVHEPIPEPNRVVLLGDVDGDGTDDLIQVGQPALGGDVYVSRGRSDGSFEHLAAQDVGIPCASGCSVVGGDFNGDGRLDLLWNELIPGNGLRVALGTPSGRFDTTPVMQFHPANADWSLYEVVVGDVNDDGRDDVIWVSPRSETRLHLALARAASEPTK